MQVLMKITKIKNLKGPPFFFKKKKEEKKVNLNSIFKVWIHYIHLRNCKFSICTGQHILFPSLVLLSVL